VTSAHDFGTGCYVSEPVFVPRPGAADEDDGWVLSLVYDSTDHHSFLGIVDGINLEWLHARLHLPFTVPLTFHGNLQQKHSAAAALTGLSRIHSKHPLTMQSL
jgi:carotenoid cleavage dioxygenase-like enzyme